MKIEVSSTGTVKHVWGIYNSLEEVAEAYVEKTLSGKFSTRSTWAYDLVDLETGRPISGNDFTEAVMLVHERRARK